MGRTGAQPAPAPAAAAPRYRAVLRAPGMRAVFAAHAVSMAGKLAAEVAVSNVAALHSPEVPWARPTSAVRELTGRDPRPYRQWAVANAALFR
ncbi:hypothetical protein ROS62_26285 [Streptomyces sp. DSM 41972]|uniref:Uncharacterized protein n=1 Tax=Streptomyces althioticus subsp. attaecolombicae TaxID=3075534 RepID=A0ABU3I5H4_9ACTN|nr:hypothetical protein [Streptomyces sp. DSM 41972]SCD88575.1 hypothetical protein GA0115238_130610 [Streptomyces sp. di50b]SCE11132.1 hypothetical protein GA0115245_121410 [Streptomyces sp. di188]